LGWQATPRTLPVPPLTYWEGSQKEQGRKNAGARRRNWHVIDALLVEDSPDYARLIQETFRDVNANVNFHMVSEGEEAMDFLVHPGAANPRSDQILLDLGMPRMDGREVPAELKAPDDRKSIPTLVLTTSDMQNDIATSITLWTWLVPSVVENQGTLPFATVCPVCARFDAMQLRSL
jgi:CheY-like chemotaxis protein